MIPVHLLLNFAENEAALEDANQYSFVTQIETNNPRTPPPSATPRLKEFQKFYNLN